MRTLLEWGRNKRKYKNRTLKYIYARLVRIEKKVGNIDDLVSDEVRHLGLHRWNRASYTHALYRYKEYKNDVNGNRLFDKIGEEQLFFRVLYYLNKRPTGFDKLVSIIKVKENNRKEELIKVLGKMKREGFILQNGQKLVLTKKGEGFINYIGEDKIV